MTAHSKHHQEPTSNQLCKTIKIHIRKTVKIISGILQQKKTKKKKYKLKLVNAMHFKKEKNYANQMLKLQMILQMLKQNRK